MKRLSHGRRGMAVIQVGLLVVSMLLVTALPASAAYGNESATVNGGAGAAVAPGGSLNVTFTVSLSSGDDWRGTRWEFRQGGSAVTSGCVDTPDHTTNGGPYTEAFTLTAPATAGIYTLRLQAEATNDCSSGTDSDTRPGTIAASGNFATGRNRSRDRCLDTDRHCGFHFMWPGFVRRFIWNNRKRHRRSM